MRLFAPALFCALAAIACESHSPAARQYPGNSAPRREAAQRLTMRYADSPVGSWNVRATAAGTNCEVLLIEMPMPVDTSTVEAMHHGVAAYDFFPGGVNRFRREHAFRGVAYKDSSGYLWEYGNITAADLQALTPPCR